MCLQQLLFPTIAASGSVELRRAEGGGGSMGRRGSGTLRRLFSRVTSQDPGLLCDFFVL